MTFSFCDIPEPSESGRFSYTVEPKVARFGFFTRSEVLNLSVKRIVVPESYDALGHPIEGGLYDPALGPTERDQGSCPTCGLDSTQCPGHLGHVELVVPVYNPLIFLNLFRLLSIKCFGCHGFRSGKLASRILKVKLLLLEANLYEEACKLETQLEKSRGGSWLAPKLANKAKDDEVLARYESVAMGVLTKATSQSEATSSFERRVSRKPTVEMHVHCRALWNESVGAFFASQPQVCQDCHEPRTRLRKAGNSKIFMTPAARKGTKSGNVEESDDDDDDDDDRGDTESKTPGAKGVRKEVFAHPLEVENHLRKLWKSESGLVSRIWGSHRPGEGKLSGYKCFFLQTLAVPPSRFRPPAKLDGVTFEHPQSTALQTILKCDNQIREKFQGDEEGAPDLLETKKTESGDEEKTRSLLTRAMESWIQLQESVNVYLDSSKAPARGGTVANPGVRQILEKKEGLFRQNMMGKRVNYACRSVISPDPYIATDEVGLPVRFAKKLFYPEPVTSWNAAKLAQMVIHGAEKWPGAAFVEDEDGVLTDLSSRSERQRIDIANRLQDLHAVGLQEDRLVKASRRFTPGEEDGVYKREHNRALAALSLKKQKKVWRHVQTGDVMLANRQPTLHKPSLMAHKVRVINNDDMQTIRLHYANCNSYNADFDGDEINLHLPQSELCRAEAFEVAYTNHQYCSTTDGEPLRGLIQDHIDMGVMLTRLGTFLDKEEYSQMVFAACDAMRSRSPHIKLQGPAVLKPKSMWTGKQVISTLIMHLVGTEAPEELVTMGPRKSKIPAQAWKSHAPGKKLPELVEQLLGDEAGPLGETQVVVRQGQLCTGVLDKSQFGASKHGLVHSIYELYGPNAAGELLSAFGRLFTFCAQKWGHTCAIEDLVLTPAAEEERTKNIQDSIADGVETSAKFAGLDPGVTDTGIIAKALESKIRVNNSGDDMEAFLDSSMQATTSKVQSKIIGDCLPKGQRKPFPENCFSLMIYSGAKGSLVNHSQVSCALGQQALEGRRVPRTIAGKSLPCFSAFDPTPRAGGYVSDRFLTGVRPQEYYFHCMAGREGLIDTAVKTARSGYLQRCLVKHLEDLSVQYDRTVRVSDGSCVQFLYGEDGLDAVNTSFLQGCGDTLGFLYNNIPALAERLKVGSESTGRLDLSGAGNGIDVETASRLHGEIVKCEKKTSKLHATNQLIGDIAVFAGGSGLARRPTRISKSSPVCSGKLQESALLPGFHRVRIAKTRKKDGTVDLVYLSDSQLLKRFPLSMLDDQGRDVPLLFGSMPDPVLSQVNPNSHLGAICESLQKRLDDYIESNPQKLIKDTDDALTLKQLVWVKYLKSMVSPGENVGVIAAQSIGEPSTQMTLNTFHLAGHGAGNVTLGIPRMRELLMTASQDQKTPSMTLPLRPGVARDEAEALKSSLYRLCFEELLLPDRGVKVREQLSRRSTATGRRVYGGAAGKLSASETGSGEWNREYEIQFSLQPLEAVKAQFGLSLDEIGRAATHRLAPVLLKLIKKELTRGGSVLKRKSGKATDGETAGNDPDGMDEGENSEVAGPGDERKAGPRGSSTPEDDEQDEDGSSDGGSPSTEDGNLRFHARKEVDGYDSDSGDSDSSSPDDEGSESDSDDSEPEALSEAKSATERNGSADGYEVSAPISVSCFSCWAGCFVKEPTKSRPATITIRLRFAASAKKLLMVGIVASAVQQAIVKDVPGITTAYLVEGSDSRLSIATAGSNFTAAFELGEKIDLNRISSNDVGAFLRVYGVEAARAAIVKEVSGVFGAYGIGVDPRHVGLVADYMTFEGGYKALNRRSMKSTPSPFSRMTFETSASFLTSAALSGESDTLKSVSSRLCTGQLLASGTGAFDLHVPSSLKPKQGVVRLPAYSLQVKERILAKKKPRKRKL